MALSGNELRVNEETGYLEPGATHNLDGFNSDKKVLFLRHAESMWPKVGLICKTIGIARATVYNHLKLDPKFKADLDAITQGICDEMEAALVENGRKPQGFMDRIAVLRAHRAELYNPAKTVIVSHQKELSPREAHERLSKVEMAIDAEVVGAQFDPLEGAPNTP